MEKKKLIAKLNEFYSDFEMLVDDESIRNFPKAFAKIHDKFGEFIQELEEESDE